MPTSRESEKTGRLPAAANAEPTPAITVAPIAIHSVPMKRSRSSGRPRMRHADQIAPPTRIRYEGIEISCGSRCAAEPAPKTSLPDGRSCASAAGSKSAVRVVATAYAHTKTRISQSAGVTHGFRVSRAISPAARNGTLSTAPSTQKTSNSSRVQPPIAPKTTASDARAYISIAMAQNSCAGRCLEANCRPSWAVNSSATAPAASGKTHMSTA